MGNLNVLHLLLLVAALTTFASAQSCCPAGQAILRRKPSPHYCWDPISNSTSFVSLACNMSGIVLQSNKTNFFVNSAGALVIPIMNAEVEYEAGSFCVGNISSIRSVNISKLRHVAILCYDEDERTIDDEIFGYIMVVSAVFLLITAYIYAALPELRDLQGKSIINFCASLAAGLGILAAMKLVAYSDMNLCAARGFLAYFFVIASFFWANAISIQILRSMSRPSVSNYGWKEFLWYALYAWGCPAALTIAMSVVNFIPGDHLKPGIGLNHCWFFNKKQQWQYMYSVMSILIAVNICIFIYTSMLLWRHSFSSNHIKALRYKFLMTIRLFIVMGVAWIFEMIGTLVSSHIVWELLDIVNSLQGVLIFLVLVVFRRRAIKMMLRHGWLDCVAGPVERCLAVGDDEEEVVQHTIGLSMDEPNIKQ